MARWTWPLAIGLALAIAGALYYTAPREESDPAPGASASAAATALPASGSAGGVAPRPSSPAARSLDWTAPQADLEQVREAAEEAREPLEFVLADYERNAELVAWASGNADSSERGEALARCYADAADQLRGECAWTQRVVIRRTGAEVGEVVHVAFAYDEDGTDRACARMLACVSQTWRGAPAPLPPGTDEILALEFAGAPCLLGEGQTAGERRQAIAEREVWARDYVESLDGCERQACRHNARGMQACVDHLAAFSRALERRG